MALNQEQTAQDELVDLFNDIGQCALEAAERFAMAMGEAIKPALAGVQNFMDDIAVCYPDVLDEDGNWREDWPEVIGKHKQ